jgi:hypothetical protein
MRGLSRVWRLWSLCRRFGRVAMGFSGSRWLRTWGLAVRLRSLPWLGSSTKCTGSSTRSSTRSSSWGLRSANRPTWSSSSTRRRRGAWWKSIVRNMNWLPPLRSRFRAAVLITTPALWRWPTLTPSRISPVARISPRSAKIAKGNRYDHIANWKKSRNHPYRWNPCSRVQKLVCVRLGIQYYVLALTPGAHADGAGAQRSLSIRFLSSILKRSQF